MELSEQERLEFELEKHYEWFAFNLGVPSDNLTLHVMLRKAYYAGFNLARDEIEQGRISAGVRISMKIDGFLRRTKKLAEEHYGSGNEYPVGKSRPVKE